MSHSSVEVTYRPEGGGHRTRTARVDLSRIPDPESWLTNRLGPLAQCDIAGPTAGQAHGRERVDALGARLIAGMQALLAKRRAALDALSARLEAVAPVDSHQPTNRNHKEED